MANNILVINEEDLAKVVIEIVSKIKDTLQPQPAEKIYYSRTDAAKKLGISSPTLWKMTKENKIESVAVGGKVFYSEEAITKAYQTRNFKPNNL